MRAAVCHTYGSPEDLRIEELPTPLPQPGQIVADVAFAAVNFPDVLMIANRYQVSLQPPFVPGSEFAGTVRAVGEGVTDLAVGDRVFGAAFVGGFAEQVVAPAAAMRKVAATVPLELAAGFWVAHATSYHALRSVAEVGPGETVVVLGAAGGVGLAAVEIAVHLGATVIAAASSEEKLALCRERGAAQTIDYSTTDLRDGIRAIVPGGADVVIDPVGGPYAERALRATRWGGRFVTVGFASGEIPRIPLNLVLLKGVVIKGFEVRTFAEFAPEQAARDERELLELLASGGLRPHISSIHPLDDVGAALRIVADRKATGKVLIQP